MPLQTAPSSRTTAGLTSAEAGELSPYHYLPTERICILFIVLFSISGVIHVVQAGYSRTYWLFPTVVAGVAGEVIGWAGRLWSNHNVLLNVPFKMQLVTLVIAPTPLLAAIFVILGMVIERLGPQYSRLSPRWYSVVFVSCDVVALLLQAAGGGAASSTAQNSVTVGGHLLLAGIAFQLGAMSVFMILSAEFLLRYYTDRPVRVKLASAPYPARVMIDRPTVLTIISIALSTLFLFVRAIYRTIELANGWEGRVIRVQRYFNGMDGAMVALAVFTLNVLHPGFLLGSDEERAGEMALRKI
ncbi:RTA1-domain-containing protein [Neolentinus lepideus HHB14362 ss-1]|uniref:RTA1-domain-containing protein n=1 Tax=Neolentinus lepideus HHB14362 ss-1 TaxID=1314782 RepID=A0A165NPS4_9AGAM|nr:RTA1-domain-containing protein [Neolentinus lepideus HHB14362 ss-1]